MSNLFALTETLQSLNFSEKETNVYLALLEMGRGTVSQIARKAKINRSTGYVILDILAGKNLVNILGKEPKQEYVAESPKKLVELLQQKLRSGQEQLEKAQAVLPELESIYNVQNRPKVKFYEGEKGLVEVYEITLTATERIRAYGGVEDMWQALPNYFKNYMDRRAERGIDIRAIFADTPQARDLVAKDETHKRESALVPPDKYYSSPEFNVFDDKIVIVSYREKLGIIIESREIAEGLKKLFDLAWSESKRLDPRRP